MTDQFMRKELVDYARSRHPWWLKSDFDFTPVKSRRLRRTKNFVRSGECLPWAIGLALFFGGMIGALTAV